MKDQARHIGVFALWPGNPPGRDYLSRLLEWQVDLRPLEGFHQLGTLLTPEWEGVCLAPLDLLDEPWPLIWRDLGGVGPAPALVVRVDAPGERDWQRALDLGAGEVLPVWGPEPQSDLLARLCRRAWEAWSQGRERRQLDDRLKRSERRFQEAAQQFPGVVFQTETAPNRELTVHYISGGASQLLGLKEAEVLEDSRHLFELLDQAERQRFWQTMERAVARGGNYRADHRLVSRDGREFWMRCEASQQDLGQGHHLWTGVALDVTQSKMAEDALRQSEQSFKLLAEKASDIICLHDPDGRWRYLNPSMARLSGYEPAELVGLDPYQYVHPQDLERIRKESHLPALAGHTHQPMEYRFRHKNGHYLWLETYTEIIKDDQGVPRLMVTSTREVTQRKQRSEAVERDKEAWERTFDAVPDLISLHDQDFRIVKANRAVARRLGLSLEEMLGRHCYEVFHHSQAPPADCPHLKTMQDGRQHSLELEEPVLQGFFEVTTTALRDARGRALGAVHVARDVTGNREASRRTQAALAEKEVLLKEIHHRVKNNMQVIQSLLSLQAARIENPQVRKALQESQNRVQAMALIHQALYQSESLALVRLEDYVKKLVDNLMEIYTPESGHPRLEIDARGVLLKLEQAVPCGLVINELVTNSLKYAFPGKKAGTLAIRASMDEKGWVELHVEDDGKGLDPHIMPQNLDSLGLRLVSRLVEHQLRGSLEKLPGKGARFLMRWPTEN